MGRDCGEGADINFQWPVSLPDVEMGLRLVLEAEFNNRCGARGWTVTQPVVLLLGNSDFWTFQVDSTIAEFPV